MHFIRQLLLFSILVLPSAWALDLKDLSLEGDLYGRSSVNFSKSANNIEYVVPKGTKGEVVESRRLKSNGSYAIRIRVNALPEGANSRSFPKIGDSTWVYFNESKPLITFFDKVQTPVEEPGEVLVAGTSANSAVAVSAEAVVSPNSPPHGELVRPQQTTRNPERDPNIRRNSNPADTEAGAACISCETTTGDTGTNLSDLRQVAASLRPAPRPDTIKPGLRRSERPARKPASSWSAFPEVMRYSNSRAVTNSINYGIRHYGRKRSGGFCYRGVKHSIKNGGLVNKYINSAFARNGVQDLKREGFINMLEHSKYKNLIKSPKDAPKGAILVYKNSSNRIHPGHIEIRTDWGTNGGFVSDFYRSANNTIRNRTLIGVMIKP